MQISQTSNDANSERIEMVNAAAPRPGEHGRAYPSPRRAAESHRRGALSGGFPVGNPAFATW